MGLQLALLHVRLLALITLKRFVIRVDISFVKIEFRFGVEGLLTHSTLIVPHLAVSYLVNLQVNFTLEAGMADVALYWLFLKRIRGVISLLDFVYSISINYSYLSMRQHVHLQCLSTVELLIAD